MEIDSIKEVLNSISKTLRDTFKRSLICLILYGSWAKGTAREDSDIDLILVLDKVNRDITKILHDCERKIDAEKNITLVPTTIEDFKKEKIPLFTAAKKEGIVIFGDVDLAINPELPGIKYAEFFKKSVEFESKKIKMAEEILKEHPSYSSIDLCFVAAKHAIQAALAMRGVGYSSKVAVLLPLAEEYFGKEIAHIFRKLYRLYVKSEYGFETLLPEEARLAIEYAEKVLKVCGSQVKD